MNNKSKRITAKAKEAKRIALNARKTWREEWNFNPNLRAFVGCLAIMACLCALGAFIFIVS